MSENTKSIRVRESDLEESIHPSHGKVPEKRSLVTRSKARYQGMDETDDIVVYTISGKQDDNSPNGYPMLFDAETRLHGKNVVQQAEDRAEAYAKQTYISEDRYKLEIRCVRGTLFNPMDPMGTPKQSIRGADTYSWITVEPTTFKVYLRFLVTKNQSFYRDCNRNI